MILIIKVSDIINKKIFTSWFYLVECVPIHSKGTSEMIF